jgi:hypothetical protein
MHMADGARVPQPVANDRLGPGSGEGIDMRRGTLKIAQSGIADRDDQAAMTAALERLYGAAIQSVTEIVKHLSASERAKLAVLCYGRAHLNAIGLAIAATCEMDHLIAASSSATAGHALFTQSRDGAPEKPSASRRPTITLAAGVGRQFADLSEAAELPA